MAGLRFVLSHPSVEEHGAIVDGFDYFGELATLRVIAS
jgi:hypothetical protein